MNKGRRKHISLPKYRCMLSLHFVWRFNMMISTIFAKGPQPPIPWGGTDEGPYCNPLTDSEKALLVSVLQEVSNFEMLKDVRNALKDSKKDLEGRLYGYNPDFSNLIASAEEFIHGKSSCMEPSPEEMECYKMPVSLVYSEEEVKFLKSKPPVYSVGSENPSKCIKKAIEESTKLFWNAVIHATCSSRNIATTKRNVKAIIVIEDNNEALELLTVALSFFEKTPLATFQSKYCSNYANFLLSIDAVRRIYGNSPPSSSKKEDEHTFEHWLEIGLNGILSSFQNRLVLIDFPRPGRSLQKSKAVLFNRLKQEDKLYNVKSFILSKPSRKEDNLSTVENVLDEIQMCLDPRDKLLFRKARRVYLDLKLYKQLEQKSRQDLKALRDWGLPEPDNEHGLWERLRNSDIVTNVLAQPPPQSLSSPSPIPTTPRNESEVEEFGRNGCPNRTEGVDASGSQNITSDEDVTGSTMISNTNRNTDSTDENELDEAEIVPVGTIRTNPVMRISEEPELRDELQLSDGESGSSRENDRFPEDLEESHENEDELPCFPIPIPSPFNLGESEGELSPRHIDSLGDDDEDLSSITDADGKPVSPTLKNKSAVGSPQSYSDSTENSHVVSLKRSTGYFNLLDEAIFKAHRPSPECDLGELGGDEGDSSSNDIRGRSPEYTRLEFTLAPKVTSSESSVGSITSLYKSVGKRKTNTSEESMLLPLRKRSFPETCIAHFGKLSKSFSQILRKRKPRRIFPSGLLSPSLRSQSRIHNSDETDGSSSGMPEAGTVNLRASREAHSEELENLSKKSSNSSIRTNPSNDRTDYHTNWLNNFVRFIRGKVHKKRNE